MGGHKKSPLDAGTSNGAGERAHHENTCSITDLLVVGKGGFRWRIQLKKSKRG